MPIMLKSASASSNVLHRTGDISIYTGITRPFLFVLNFSFGFGLHERHSFTLFEYGLVVMNL